MNSSVKPTVLHLFQGVGIELEYMIVHRETLDVLPVCDEIIYAVTGNYDSEIEMGALNWSNELVLHVIELKTNGPAKKTEGLPECFQKDITHINQLLEPMNGMLMPTAMHPWMNPDLDTRLWPHEYSPVYEMYNSIFGCHGHGWSNLQSMHINLPFDGDEEFGALHAAIRLILPILPALAASSPVMEGGLTGLMDSRLDAYRQNQVRIPSLTGRIIPEAIYTQKNYEHKLLAGLYRDIAPFDPKGIMQNEWINSRGAIARFDRQAIEIRVLDIAECPLMDLTIASMVQALLQSLTEETWTSYELQKTCSVEKLADILEETIQHADQAVIADKSYLKLFGYTSLKASASELWQFLYESRLKDMLAPQWHASAEHLLSHGPLARRIVRRLGPKPAREELHQCYQALAQCLASGKPFGE